MAGIKETKERLREELKQLHQQLSAMQGILSAENAAQSAWLHYADVCNEFAAKATLLAHLMPIEELQPETKLPPTLVPEIKLTETIVPPPEKNIPPLPEVNKPEIVQSPPAQGGKIYPDLRSLIGLNEKIMFVRSLFNSSGTEYENAIALINACTSWPEAGTALQELASSRNWQLKSEPVEVFYSLVKRRFA